MIVVIKERFDYCVANMKPVVQIHADKTTRFWGCWLHTPHKKCTTTTWNGCGHHALLFHGVPNLLFYSSLLRKANSEDRQRLISTHLNLNCFTRSFKLIMHLIYVHAPTFSPYIKQNIKLPKHCSSSLV